MTSTPSATNRRCRTTSPPHPMPSRRRLPQGGAAAGMTGIWISACRRRPRPPRHPFSGRTATAGLGTNTGSTPLPRRPPLPKPSRRIPSPRRACPASPVPAAAPAAVAAPDAAFPLAPASPGIPPPAALAPDAALARLLQGAGLPAAALAAAPACRAHRRRRQPARRRGRTAGAADPPGQCEAGIPHRADHAPPRRRRPAENPPPPMMPRWPRCSAARPASRRWQKPSPTSTPIRSRRWGPHRPRRARCSTSWLQPKTRSAGQGRRLPRRAGEAAVGHLRGRYKASCSSQFQRSDFDGAFGKAFARAYEEASRKDERRCTHGRLRRWGDG